MKIKIPVIGISILLFCGCSLILESLFAGELTVYIHDPSEYNQKTSSFYLSGTVYTKESEVESISVRVSPGDYTNTVSASEGSWSIWVELSEGANTVSVWATGTNGDTGSSATKDYFVDTVKPLITFSSGYIGKTYFSTSPVTFTGTIYEANGLEFFIYECSVGMSGSFPKVNGNWSVTITNLQFNTNYIFEMIAEDSVGWKNKTNFKFYVTNTNI
ncbi:MAG: hypothetical protein HPY53_10040 [Brevinematales bacterium]|nr:hypothetical protein [Brevinematales bacterium]